MQRRSDSLAEGGGQNYLTVSELSVLLNRALEQTFPEVYFEGEVSQVIRARSGHVYFTVKDATSQLSAVMWSGLFEALDFPLDQGLSVQCHGRPNIYKSSGRLQIIVHRIFPSGEGALRKKFLELKAKLELEGFFAEQRKRRLPFLPRAVGVVTSRSGAVIHDIMVRIRERMPSLQVYLVDTKVQGEGAAEEIAAGVRLLDRSKLVDVIIVARGGGSLEDLWAFNEEVVVKAIFASSTPVISGVGHEVDISLSDLVADVRAPTPTAASEIVVPRRDDLVRRLDDLERRLTDTEHWLNPLAQRLDELSLRLDNRISGLLEEWRLRLAAAIARVKGIEPAAMIRNLQARVESITAKLATACAHQLAAKKQELELADSKLKRAFPMEQLGLFGQRLSSWESRLGTAVRVYYSTQAAAVERLQSHLEAVSPQRVLQRGFSIVEAHGSIIRSADEVKEQELVKISFASGGVRATITEKLMK